MTRHGLTAEERFWAKVDQSGECWEWLSSPQFRDENGITTARNYAFRLLVAPTEGRQVAVTCGNKKCVNPHHLEIPALPPHGELGRYMHYKCRCDLCKAANSARCRELNAQRASEAKDPNDPRHGTAGFYTNHKCRCERCRTAHREKCAKEYAARKARSAA